MKKTILLAFLGAGLFTANAQTTAATLNVRLYPIQTIELNNTPSNTVNLDYKTAADYEKGVEVDQAEHLKIYSTGGFSVTVNSTSNTLSSTENNENIAAKDIKITASAGTGNQALTNGTFSEAVILGETPIVLFSSKIGGIANTVNINYSTKGNTKNNYLNMYKKAQNPTVYTTNVVYTIAAS